MTLARSAGLRVEPPAASPALGRAGHAPKVRRPASRLRGRPTTAFVLSGGASLGALQVGMLRALYEREIVPDLLVGASVGALNAAFVASRPQVVATADELARVWQRMQRQDIFPIDLRVMAGGLWGRRDHVIGAQGLERIVRRHLELEELDDAPIPLHVVAFDLAGGREVRLSSGSALEAILGAAAIPGILPPVRWGQHRLVDAAVINNTPISHAVALGAERIYVLPTLDLGRDDAVRPPRSALDAALRALGGRTSDHLRADLVRFALDVELIVLPAPNEQRVQPTDFRHAERLAAGALAAARAALAETTDGGGRVGALAHLYVVSPLPS
jgi:NTE family protein